MSRTETKYCNREDAAILVRANETTVPLGGRIAIIRFDSAFGVIPPSDQLAVYLDFASSTAGLPEAAAAAQQVIERLFADTAETLQGRDTEQGGIGLTLGVILMFGGIASIT